MEHDNVEFGNAVTSLATAWYRARSLKKVEFGNWTGENCNINNISSAFQQCHLIEKIDLTQWNTVNWHVTSISSLFQDCFNLKICIVPFNTSQNCVSPFVGSSIFLYGKIIYFFLFNFGKK
jgi:hypothetical protein